MILGIGAEAVVELVNDKVVKRRVPKAYRVKELDERIRKERNKLEARIMQKLRANSVNVPRVLEIRDFEIVMEFVDGRKVRELSSNEIKSLSYEFGKIIGKMHALGIAHNDLTTSNFLLAHGKLYLIDFGLAEFSSSIEDFATDIHVFLQSMKATHRDALDTDAFWRGYCEEFKQCEKVKERLKLVESRGRYKVRSS